MKKRVLLSSLLILTVVGFTPALADSQSSGPASKISSAAKSVGRGIMWGPKKIGEGLKAAGAKIKDTFHKK